MLRLPRAILFATARVWLVPAVAWAESDLAGSSEKRTVEEIVVTAQRKEENLQHVPISITAIDGDFARRAGAEGLHEVVKFAPNVQLNTLGCCANVFMRGFGTPFPVSAFEPSVGIVIDELSLSREVYLADPIYDIERFELLRGPQGTLFGKNTPAGLIALTTRRPTREPTGYVLGRIGNLGAHRIEAAAGGSVDALADWLQMRIAAVESRDPGDVENTKLGNEEPATRQRGARLELALQPFDDLDLLVLASGAETDGGFLHLQLTGVGEPAADFLRGFDSRFEEDPLNHRTSKDFRNDLERGTYLLLTNARWRRQRLAFARDLDLTWVAGVTGYDQSQRFDADFSPADIARLEGRDGLRYDQVSSELRLSATVPSPFGLPGELEILGGYHFLDGRFVSDNDILAGEDADEFFLSAPAFELITGIPAVGGLGFEDVGAVAAALGLNPLDLVNLGGDGLRLFLDQEVRSHALFGNLAWRPSPRWLIGLGVRLMFEEKKARARTQCLGVESSARR